jgi:catechol 2,3-dioxygenase-like lactoylglutathione lyase family enzyme
MSRLQLALNVTDIDEAVGFYSTLFATEPAKRRPGYANFAVADPPLKLVLIENAVNRGTGTHRAFDHDIPGALNHLGVEVRSPEEVTAATRRLSAEGLATATEEAASCCHAIQDKVWVEDPNGTPWEVYAVLADDPDAVADSSGSTTGATGRAATSGVSVVTTQPATCC